MKAFSRIRNAMVFAFPPPPVIELGNATGIRLPVARPGRHRPREAHGGPEPASWLACKGPAAHQVRPNGMEDVPQYRVDVDWEKAGALGVPITSIHNTISDGFGSAYVNNFIQGGRVKRVYAQADAPYRMLPEDIERLYVRNTAGKMVPFSAFASGRWTSGSPRLERFNGFSVDEHLGRAAAGEQLRRGHAGHGGDRRRSCRRASGSTGPAFPTRSRWPPPRRPLLYAFSVIVIFLCVAALYESWTIPLANLLMLPLGLFGAALATWSRGMHNDVYFQIGFLTTLGLSTKNAILIIQFAKEQMAQGDGLDRGDP